MDRLGTTERSASLEARWATSVRIITDVIPYALSKRRKR
jgi:hypothetical protein